MFKDENGLPVALDMDGGDTLQRTGAWCSGYESQGISSRPLSRFALRRLYVGRGEWRRHPGRDGIIGQQLTVSYESNQKMRVFDWNPAR